jgi:hypothetical protein
MAANIITAIAIIIIPVLPLFCVAWTHSAMTRVKNQRCEERSN